jgi:hypothetical protein
MIVWDALAPAAMLSQCAVVDPVISKYSAGRKLVSSKVTSVTGLRVR